MVDDFKHHLDVNVLPKGRHIQDVLPNILNNMKKAYASNPELLFTQWNKVVGEEIASMAKPVMFKDKVLYIKVTSSTLLSILDRQEKPRLLKHLQQVCPQSQIQNILFKVGSLL